MAQLDPYGSGVMPRYTWHPRGEVREARPGDPGYGAEELVPGLERLPVPAQTLTSAGIAQDAPGDEQGWRFVTYGAAILLLVAGLQAMGGRK